ncbi:hypothetical protein ACTQ5K_08705 [Niallia sp. Sow4_A1]|uniref:hypothetical protein n=1 Tax=unclassified Niallia TaxID=2837522 RepID=UPI00203C0735|nr:hypothetical protein [Niallia sp. MER TA 168]MCM3364218.1 hypothetical protein [Niallia sp. MER TA 168]
MINGNSQRGEGKEGWEFANFIGLDNTYMGGNIITRSETGENTTLYQNPSLKLATEEEKVAHPTWYFRNTGANVEKSYAEDNDKTGDFYI